MEEGEYRVNYRESQLEMKPAVRSKLDRKGD